MTLYARRRMWQLHMCKDLCTGWPQIAPLTAAPRIASKQTAGNRTTGDRDIAPTLHDRKGDTKPPQFDIRAAATRVDDGATRRTNVTWWPWDYFYAGTWRTGQTLAPSKSRNRIGSSGMQTSCRARSVRLEEFSLGIAKSQTSRKTKSTWNAIGISSLRRTRRNDSHGAQVRLYPLPLNLQWL